MTMLKLTVTADPVTIEVSKADYQDQWDEYCEDKGDGPGSKPSDEFVREQVQEELKEGDRDLSETFESASIGVKIA